MKLRLQGVQYVCELRQTKPRLTKHSHVLENVRMLAIDIIKQPKYLELRNALYFGV